jgi:hypothetical protein
LLLSRRQASILFSFTSDDSRTALTDDGIDEPRDMITTARLSLDEWDQFLEDCRSFRRHQDRKAQSAG